jgi:hypothetical protein
VSDDKEQLVISGQQIVWDDQVIGREAMKPGSVTYDGTVYLDPDLGPFLPTDPANKAYVDASTVPAPRGTVSIWHGALTDVAPGWGACDGKWYNPNDPATGQVGQGATDATHTVQTCTIADIGSGIHYIEKL